MGVNAGTLVASGKTIDCPMVSLHPISDRSSASSFVLSLICHLIDAQGNIVTKQPRLRWTA